MAGNGNGYGNGHQQSRHALVLSGGGARGAYEAGVLNYIRSALKPSEGGERNFHIQCGSSVGAINSCFMASHAHDPKLQGKMIRELWLNLEREQIYRRNISALGSFLGRTGKSITSNLLKFRSKTPEEQTGAISHFRGFLDTSPLPQYLRKVIPYKKIGHNIAKGIIDAVTVTVTNVSSGRMELFIQKRPNLEYTGEYTYSLTEITPEHTRASAAIPLIFHPIRIKDTYYTDGGIKQNTPMAPAIQLGASKIMLIGSHHAYEHGEKLMYTTPASSHPSLGQLVGLIMNAIFLGRLQYDVEQLNRINRMIEWSEAVYGEEYLDKINTMLRENGQRGDIANRGLKKIRLLPIFPSQDISELFSECYQDKTAMKDSFSAFEKILLRLLDIDPHAGVDILSYLGFMPHYIERLLTLGYNDAAARKDEIIDFLLDEDS